MRVLLSRPPRRDLADAGLSVPPLGLAYIGAALLRAGHEVEILDAAALGWTWARYESELRRRRPELLGLSAMTPVADIAARAVRLARPHARWLLLGGPHPTALRAAVFEEMPELDAAVVGEGERVAPALLSWLQAGRPGPPPPGALLPGLPFQEAEPEPQIETLPRPARHLLPQSRYRYLFATRPGLGTLITSRGCPFRCSFCDKSVSGSRWRARGAVDVVDEMEEMARSGIGFINIYDDNFTLRRRRVEEICEEILRRRLDVEWKCEGRVDGVDLDLLRLMRRAGCRTVAYGVESGNPATLALLRKDIRVEQARAAFADTRAAGLRSLAYMILGAPGEGPEEVSRSVEFCRELGADYVQFSSLVALPGTPLFASHTGRAADVRNPLDADLRRVTLTDLPPEQLSALMRQAWLGFYLRPRPLARLAADALASGSLAEALRMGGALGRWALQAP